MKKIPLTQGKEFIIDDEDYPYVSRFKWYKDSNDRVVRDISTIKGGKYRLALVHLLIQNDTGCYIRHLNGNTLDNRKENLASIYLNAVIQSRPIEKKHKTSKYRGVFWSSQKKKWQAAITKGKQIHIGFFDDENAAALAYNRKALEIYGDFAYQNDVK